MLVKARLSAVKVSKHRFTQRRSLVKLEQARLGTVKVCKRSFHNFRSVLKNVKACLSAGKIQNVVLATVDVF